ncbi:endocuticle structural glycoprotein SgAbd-3 [Scaptodrosophila lebanonensis]|uniref:Endocuticle structural glycoprotein SgAbd-3 n=1 Tax=Drosophila lebanonensis TaxID=7225 RepID=A0A6J2UMD8_DROLE|nr:endocuticle structural glycoprotein SgAbd-3 [Scaptodrosophila lebanonensis]
MKLLYLLGAFILIGGTDAVDDGLISHESNVEYDGKFHYHFETKNGTKVTQDGLLKHVNAEHDGESIQGKFSFKTNDGQEFAISYIADENGFQPTGAHLPTPPPIPESVLKTLKYLEEHPQQKKN